MKAMKVCELKEIPKEMQPAIRCKAYGPKCLTDDELLGIILGSSKIRSIDIKDIASRNYRDFREAGCSDRDALKLVSLSEWASRYCKTMNPLESYSTPQAIAAHMMADAKYEPVEWFRVLHLDGRNHIILEEEVAKGTRNGCMVDIQAIYKSALCRGSDSIILCHNHPSGSLEPSPEDIQMTQKIADGCKALDCIKLTDHIIVSSNGYYSFRENGLI